MKSFIRVLLVGRNHIASRIDYKSAMLRGYMALIAITVALAYVISDFFNNFNANYPYYGVVFLLSTVTILLNRKHKFYLANLLFLFTLNLLIFLFASSDLHRTGIHAFFICISLAAFSFLGFRSLWYSLGFSALSIALFVIAYWGDYGIMPPLPNDPGIIKVTFTINFMIAFTTSMLIVYFLIDINHHSEQTLLRATNDLQKSRERTDLVVEASKAGIYEWRHFDQSIFVSPAWRRLLGYPESTEVNIPFYFSLLHPDERDLVKVRMDNHLRDGLPYSNETRLKTYDGEFRWFHDSGNTKFDTEGNAIITVGSIVDINDRKQDEEKIIRQNNLLLKANKELDQFVYSVSHDLRAPLSSILGLTNVFSLSDDPKEKETIIKLINDRAQTLDAFIREILDYSRNTRTELKIKSVGVAQVVDEVVTGLANISGFAELTMEIEIEPNFAVLSDRERIKVILNNLISNAIKYRDPNKNSFIRIKSWEAGSNWMISVADNGIGIREEDQGKIFEMFYRAHEQSSGSGLGLYIVTEAVSRLHGTIQVSSEIGQGSTFSVQIPKIVSEAPVEAI